MAATRKALKRRWKLSKVSVSKKSGEKARKLMRNVCQDTTPCSSGKPHKTKWRLCGWSVTCVCMGEWHDLETSSVWLSTLVDHRCWAERVKPVSTACWSMSAAGVTNRLSAQNHSRLGYRLDRQVKSSALITQSPFTAKRHFHLLKSTR